MRNFSYSITWHYKYVPVLYLFFFVCLFEEQKEKIRKKKPKQIPRTQGYNLWLSSHDCFPPPPPPHHFQENYLVYSLIFCTVKIQSISTGHLLKFSTSLCSILGLLLESLAFSIVQLPGLMMPLGQVLVWQKYRRQYMTSQQFQLKPVCSSDRRKHTDDK